MSAASFSPLLWLVFAISANSAVNNIKEPVEVMYLSISVLVTIASLLISPVVRAYQVTDELAVSATLAAAYQFQDVNKSSGAGDTGRGGFVFEPEISFTPSNQDEFFVKLGFAAGNGINDVSPFHNEPWIADLQDVVTDINGRGYSYLLNAWYEHTFHLGIDKTLGLTAGIIDATDYVDVNAYANDEITQFMNAALVNGPNAFVPAYDVGGAPAIPGVIS